MPSSDRVQHLSENNFQRKIAEISQITEKIIPVNILKQDATQSEQGKNVPLGRGLCRWCQLFFIDFFYNQNHPCVEAKLIN
jgi:hypothetical protein